MKKIYLLLILLSVFATTSNAQILLAHYPLTNDLHDATGNNGDYQLLGNPAPSGVSTDGACLNGVYWDLQDNQSGGQSSSTAKISNLDVNNFELTCDFFISSYPGQTSPVFMGGTDTRFLGFEIEPQGTMSILYNSSAGYITSNYSISLNQWHNAVLKHTANYVQLIIDGQQAILSNIGSVDDGGHNGFDDVFATTDYSDGGSLKGCVKDVYIYDSPLILDVPDTITVASNSNCTAKVTYSGVNAYSDSSVNVSYSIDNNSLFSIGSTAVQVTATSSVSTVIDSFVVTVTDNNQPLITCNADVTDLVADRGECSASGVTIQDVFGSDCSGDLLLATNNAPSVFPVGTTTVTWSVTHGDKTSTCPQKFTVHDRQAPVIACPGDTTINNDPGQCNAVFNYNTPTATDNCKVKSITQIAGPASGQAFNLGTTTVTYVAADSTGNTDTCRFHVTVVDHEAPVITCRNDTTVNTTGTNCSVVVNYSLPTATDNCGSPTVFLGGGQASGTDFFGGTTKVTYVAIDNAGNKDSCSFNVIVNVIQPPTWYQDIDHDGYYGATKDTCYSPGHNWSLTTLGPDCDDNNPDVHAAPALSVTGPNGGCKNQTGVTFSVDSVSGYTYAWTVPAGATGLSTSNSISVNFSNAYKGGSICVQATDGTCISGDSCKAILLFTVAPAKPSAINGPTGACGNTTYTYSITGVPTATYYNWNPPDDATVVAGQGTTTASIYFNSKYAGGTLLVKAFNCIGAGGSQTLDIARIRVPDQPGNITGQTTGLCDNVYMFRVAPVNYAYQYSWTVPAGCTISGDQTGNAILLNVSDDFVKGDLCVTAVNKCGLAGPAECVTLNSRPANPPAISGPASVCKNQTGVIFSVTAQAGIIYTWSVPTGCIIAGGQGTSSIYVNWGTLPGTVSVNAANVCGVPSGSTTKSVTTKTAGCTTTTRVEEGESDNDAVNELTVFPNPNNGTFEARFAQVVGTAQMEIYNAVGQRVFNQTVIEQKQFLDISLGNLDDGIYLIRLVSQDGVQAKRFVITK